MDAPARTLTLTERVAAVCRLTAADVDFLLAHHRAHLDLVPAGRRHRYRLTPAGVVGVIVAPACRLVLLPKIPLRNVFFLLDPDVPAPPEADVVTPVAGTEVLAFLAGQLAQRLSERAAAGLHRAYAERADQGPYLLGRLDLPAQLREGPGRKDQLHYSHDDFSADVPCNQVPRAVGELLLASPLLGEEVRAGLRRALAGFDTVRSVPLTPPLLEAGAPERWPAEYRSLLELCRLLAEGLAPGSATGATPAPAFLLDMERVFERYLTRGVLAAFAAGPQAVSVQQAHVVNEPVAGQPDVHVRPDVTIDRQGRPVLVVDAKWKRLPRAAVVTADLYQVLAYCTALGVGRAVLVYPGRRERVWDYTFVHGDVRVTLRTLNVAGSRERCTRALRRLGRELRRAAREERKV
jgi:5-methylcytosine-specific restriction enzyme subunit McrC